MSPGVSIALIVACLAGSAFFAGLETGVVAVNRLRLRHLVQHRVPGARFVEDFLREPDRLLGTTLIGTNLCHVVMTVAASSLALHLRLPAAEAVAATVTTLVLLVFGEYLPKAWFQAFPAYRTLPFARALWLASRLFQPLHALLGILTRPFLRADDADAAPPLLTREEFVHLANEGARAGILSPAEVRMITGVMSIGGIRCRDIMVPRDRVVAVDAGTPVPALLDLARTTGHSRFPVRDPARDAFVGIVNIYDVLADEGAEAQTVDAYARSPQLVSDYDLADHVMPRMRVARQPLMLVVSSAGEVVGIVTLEDVLAVVVGPPGPAAPRAK